jgi:adenosine deaminase
MDHRDFLRPLPKAELHLHLEGTLEPEMLMALARRNKVALPFRSVEEIRAAYRFSKLQDFLDIYYQGMGVLLSEEDFYDLTLAYLERVAAEGAVHVEVFFDPQGHTERGVALATVCEGILCALAEGERRLGVSSRLILCILRHLSEEAGFACYREAEPWFADGRILGIGLDSSERGHPPSKFARLFEAARADGLIVVAHAGEEGPADYVREALDLLQIQRIDHGNRALDDTGLVARIAREGIALTVCPLSNLRLAVVDDLKHHPLKRMLDAGLKATVNSDDPAYFGGYLLDNYVAVAEALDLSRAELVTLVRNSLEASFLEPATKAGHIAKLDAALAGA